MNKKGPVVIARGLVIKMDQTPESLNWPKVNYLIRKGYSREEAIAFLPRLASGEIDIDDIPDRSERANEGRDQKK